MLAANSSKHQDEEKKTNEAHQGEGQGWQLTSLGALKCRKLFLRADERAEVNNML